MTGLGGFGQDTLHRIRMMVARGTLAGVNAALKLQGLDIRLMADEAKAGVEHFEPYGFTAHPHVGAEVLAVFLGGLREHGIVVQVADRRYRIQGLEAGEVAIYSDEDRDGGHRVHLKRGRLVEVRCRRLVIRADEAVEIETPDMKVTGALTDMTGSGNTRAVHEMRDVYDTHTHTGDSGGTTSPPAQKMDTA